MGSILQNLACWVIGKTEENIMDYKHGLDAQHTGITTITITSLICRNEGIQRKP